MPKMFSVNEPKEDKESKDRSDSVTAHFYQMHCERIKRLKELIHIPEENECTFIWAIKSFNAFTFIPFCIQNFGQIDELYLSTYSINIRIVNALIKQVDAGRILRVHIFISESIQFRQATTIEHLNALIANRPNVSICFDWNHSKVTCAKCGDRYFVFEGSGNWSENAQFEQYVFVNSKEVYEFRKKIICNME